MANIYYKFIELEDEEPYYEISNTQGDGWSLWSPGNATFSGQMVYISLTDNKFTLPSSARSLFEGTYAILSDNFEKFDTSGCTNMSRMFYNASRDYKVGLNMSTWDLTNVTTMNEMFANCSLGGGIGPITIGNHSETTKLTNIGYMFNSCASITAIDLSGLNTSNVTEMRNLFRNCNTISSINVSGLFNTDKTRYLLSAFNGCSKITSLDLSAGNTSSAIDMSSMFYGCNNLTNLKVTNFSVESCTNISSMFYNCPKLAEIDAGIANWYKTYDNEANMFGNCTSLPNFDSSIVDSTKANSTPTGYFKYYESGIECEPGLKVEDVWVPVEVFL